jgi:hypothetical protein
VLGNEHGGNELVVLGDELGGNALGEIGNELGGNELGGNELGGNVLDELDALMCPPDATLPMRNMSDISKGQFQFHRCALT